MMSNRMGAGGRQGLVWWLFVTGVAILVPASHSGKRGQGSSSDSKKCVQAEPFHSRLLRLES